MSVPTPVEPVLRCTPIEHPVLLSIIEISAPIELMLLAGRIGHPRPVAPRHEQPDDWLERVAAAPGGEHWRAEVAHLYLREVALFDSFVTARSDLFGKPGKRRLFRSPSDRAPLDLDRVDVSDEELDALVCRDGDCSGEHYFLRITLPAGGWAFYHINNTTGTIAPPRAVLLG